MRLLDQARRHRLRVTCNVAGQDAGKWGDIVDSVWHHFVFERFKPHIESGEYLKHSKR